jgi:hypothetical protein
MTRVDVFPRLGSPLRSQSNPRHETPVQTCAALRGRVYTIHRKSGPSSRKMACRKRPLAWLYGTIAHPAILGVSAGNEVRDVSRSEEHTIKN